MTENILILALISILIIFVSFSIKKARLLRKLEGATKQISQLRGEIRQLKELKMEFQEHEKVSKFLTRFIQELPFLISSFHSRVEMRRIPQLLLRMVTRTFEPYSAIILLRRKAAKSDPSRANRFVVAATAPKEMPVAVGAELEQGQGKLGFVAEVKKVMSDEDFKWETRLNRDRTKKTNFSGFDPSLVAPIIFNDKDETNGIIAISGHSRNPAEKEVLRLIAKIGSLTLQNSAVYSQVRKKADIDGLTGAFNKRYSLQRIGELIHSAREKSTKLSIFLFDLDNFKNYNDLNGHLPGDHLLKELSQLVQENIRTVDIFCRYGGEEFLILMPETDEQEALAVAEKIRKNIAEHDFPHAQKQPLGIVSISGGVSTFPANGLDSSALITAADEGLYSAKSSGRNNVKSAVPQYIGAE